ncbi:MAG: IS110 family transposase, partial [Pseudomonadota bacterium]
MTVKTVGLDLAKDVFQVHCVSATGRKIINKKIKRAKLLSFCPSPVKLGHYTWHRRGTLNGEEAAL